MREKNGKKQAFQNSNSNIDYMNETDQSLLKIMNRDNRIQLIPIIADNDNLSVEYGSKFHDSLNNSVVSVSHTK